MTTLSGILQAPDGTAIAGAKITFEAVRNYEQVTFHASSSLITGSSGSYSVTLPIGSFNVFINYGTNRIITVGMVTILDDSIDGTLNDYLLSNNDPAYVLDVLSRLGAPGGVDLVNGAMDKAQNLNDVTDKAASRTNLDVDSKAESQERSNAVLSSLAGANGVSLVGGAMAKSQNLSDLSNIPTARTNLDVYSKAESIAQFGGAELSSYSAFENLYADSTFSRCVVGDAAPGWPVQVVIAEKIGELCMATPGGITGAGGYDLVKIPVANIKSRKLSISCAILEKIGDQGVNASSGLGNLRIRLSAYDSSGVLISTAWQTATGNDDPTVGTGWQYYTRNIPRTDITQKTILNVCSGITLPANAASVSINIRVEGLGGVAAPRVYLNRFSIREGLASNWVRQPEASIAYVSPAGNDSTGNGTVTLPFATLDKANDAINGRGIIYLAAGEYTNLSISNKKVKDVKIIGIEANYLSRPLIRYGTSLSGISKTAGRTYVYQAPCTGFTAGMLPPWIWLDGVNDVDTLVPQSEMHAGLRGRLYRLECTKLWRTTASDKATALTEMDVNTGLPKSHWEASEGIIYFTLPGGGDATAAGVNIYAPRMVTGIVSDVCDYFSARGSIEITGIDIRYGNVQTSGFRVSRNTDVRVLGGAVNCFDNGNWHEDIKCEASGAGSNGSSTTSDGFNTHAWSVYRHEYIYTHDNVDDGESSHENCLVHGINPIAEYNGGSGLTPAYGCQAIYINPETRKNALGTRLPTGKLGGIEANANPLAGATYARRTFIQVYNGRSYGDRNGYTSQAYSGADNQPYLIAYDSFAQDSMFFGFNCAQAVNCKYLGSGTPYNSARCNLVTGAPLA